jgi:peptide/nickel transport system substrate-binding protein
MKSTRRSVLKSTAALAAVAGAPAIAKGQARRGEAKTVRAVMHGDIPTFDPIWTTANMSAYHGGMVYDTLFGIDENYNVKPQMVGKYDISQDQLTYTMELRDGLKWTDGTAVTAKDCVASLRRWMARDGAGQLIQQRMASLDAKNEKTIELKMKERWGLVLDSMAKTSTPVCFMMREKEALTDPMQKIDTVVGSGPFTLNMAETRPGSQYVYDKNPNYVPRSEAPSGISGGKVVKLDRVIFQVMPDSQTAVAALQAGEIDFLELAPIDLIPQLASDRNVQLTMLNTVGQVGWIRLNFLHPPFNHPKARQAMLHIVNQENHMKATFADAKYYKTCASYFTCGTPMENNANTGWFNGGKPDYARAKALFAEAGYKGEEVTLLQATNIDYMRNSADILAQELRQAGVNVKVIPMDWSGVVTRRAVKTAPADGGWNIFLTSAGGPAVGNPIALAGHASTGERGWFGWPSDEKNEVLRNQWALATSMDERKKIAQQIQENAWSFVPHLYFGQWTQPSAHRTNIKNMLPMAEMVPFWNTEKV